MRKIIAILFILSILATAAFAEGGGIMGQTMPEFNVTTSDGQSLSLFSLLEAKDLVVLNIFASWCPPCRMEFPEMDRVYRERSDRMEIVAVSDEPTDTLEVIADYKAELGLSFPMGLGTGIMDFVPLQGYPTTLFIDKKGIIGYYQVGAFMAEGQFEGVVDWFLDANYDGEPVRGFNAYVCDQNSEGVPGVYVNFCTDTTCRTTISDEQGFISFAGQPESYHLQILKVPEGYSFDAGYEETCDGSGEWVIVPVNKD